MTKDTELNKVFQLIEWNDISTGSDWTTDYRIVEHTIGFFQTKDAADLRAEEIRKTRNVKFFLKEIEIQK